MQKSSNYTFFYKNSVILVQPLMAEPFFSLKYSYSILIFLQYFYLPNFKIPKTDQLSIK